MEERLRVAVTLEQLWHRVPGGTATSAIGFTRALAERNDVDLVGVSALHRSGPAPGFDPPIPVRRLPLPRPLLYDAWHRLRRPQVQAATGPVDVIHATTSAIPPRSAPLVVTVHDLAFLARSGDFTKRGMRLFLTGLDLTRSDADLVLVPSEATRAACMEQGIEEAKLRVVPWGADLTLAGDVDRVLGKHNVPSRYILWTGTLEPRKNLARLIEAFKRTDTDATLVLAGPKGWGVDVLAGAEDARIMALGFVPGSELRALYRGAAAFVYPSLQEGFGLPVLEAMAQGAPVVTSRGTSTEEVGGDAVVLVDPLDESSIADGLHAVLEDDAVQRRLREAGPRRAATFTWERTATLTLQAYRDAARMAG